MISNLRDLGGIAGEGGRAVRSGMLLRSAKLSEAEPGDLAGIAAVIDLRTPKESEAPQDKVYGAEYLSIPVFDDALAGISRDEQAEIENAPEMDVQYRLLVRCFKTNLRKILLAIMEHDYSSGAILWHCSEGKDRTGIVAALVLEMLGASREDIIEDYLKTNIVNIPKAIRMRDEVLKTEGKEVAERVYKNIIADEAYLSAAFDEMGSDYIREGLGIDESAILRFREKVLTE